jgi:hypothetical protein
MNTEQAYINGFVKRAAEYGFDQNESFAILKEANALTRALARGAVSPATVAKRMNMPLSSVQNIAGHNSPGVGINKNPNIKALDSTLAKRDSLMKTQAKIEPLRTKLHDRFDDFDDYVGGMRNIQNDIKNLPTLENVPWKGKLPANMEQLNRVRDSGYHDLPSDYYDAVEDIFDAKSGMKAFRKKYKITDKEALKRFAKMENSGDYLGRAHQRSMNRMREIEQLDRKAYGLGAPESAISDIDRTTKRLDFSEYLRTGNIEGIRRVPQKTIFHPDAKRTQQAFFARQDLQNMRKMNNQPTNMFF